MSISLKDLQPGQSARILSVGGQGSLRRHLLDMGVLPGAELTLMKFAPMGDPLELRIHSYELTLRLSDAACIEVEPIKSLTKTKTADRQSILARPHPGLGEEGKYHLEKNEPVNKGKQLRFALVGNQNCGKTTLFNQLTGSNQHVGNFPGVTVDQKSGSIRGYANTSVTDLPGIYSLSPYSAEELVTRRFILEQKPDCIINIADATNLERNLYLTMQLLELQVPMVLALNMMDELRGNGGSVDINEMEHLLGIPVIPISAAKNEGVEELIRHALHIASYEERPTYGDYCSPSAHKGAVHRCLHGIMHLIEDHAKEAAIPLRFAAGKLVEGDEAVKEALKLSANEGEMLEHIILQLEHERGLDAAAAMADMRFAFIHSLIEESVVLPHESKEHSRSVKLDRLLTGKYTAIPAFILIMGAVFVLTFNVIGSYLQELLAGGIELITGMVDSYLSTLSLNPALHSLIIDGVFTGVGSVLSFLPIILVLFFFLSLLEDTGYMARIAFVTDKLLRRIGLSGRSIVPMLIGFGCTVPAVMASRTLPSARDRKMTVLLTPFMSCTAKLPIYGFFTNLFFPKQAGLIMIGLYLLGIGVGILVGYISKSTAFKGKAVPFVMELPNYRLPGLKNVLLLLWDKSKDFLHRAFTVIFFASMLIWFLRSFNLHFDLVTDSADSILALLAGWIAPLFAPMGFGDWRICTALLAGFIAKESVVTSLSVLFSGSAALLSFLTPASVGALLVFCLLYTPCVAAVAAIKRELGGKWALITVAFQCSLAWVFSLLCYGILSLLGV